MAVFVYLFKIHIESSHFNPTFLDAILGNMSGPNAFFSAGKFDLETWTCELSNFRPDIFSSTCKVERVRRWFMLPYVLVTLVSVATGLWAFIEDRQLEKILEAEREAEKEAEQNIRHWMGSQSDFGVSERSLSPACSLPPIEKVATTTMTPYQISCEYLGAAFLPKCVV